MALAETESERERLKYAVLKSSQLSDTKAKSLYGFSDMSERRQIVEDAMENASAIREAIENVAAVKEKSLFQSTGVYDTENDESETMDAESETDRDAENVRAENLMTYNDQGDMHKKHPHEFQFSDFVNEVETYKHITDTGTVFLNTHQLYDILEKCDLNWFYFVRVLKDLLSVTKEVSNQLLLDFSGQLPFMGFSEEKEKLIEQSRQAFLSSERMAENTQDDNSHIEVQSDSDSSEAEIWSMGIQSPVDENEKILIKEKRAAIRRKSIREIKKRIAEKRVMKRRRSKRIGKLISKCPDIGQEIEEYVKPCGAGAGAWRKTGEYTFDGNRKVKKKATFKRIKKHLEAKYGRKISYGSIVQLCIARNKRRRSAVRYRGLANVVSKYNPHQHWSSALYAALDKVQFQDGSNFINIGRDDQAGFRLDTMATHKLQAMLCVKGKEHCTTRTDYVNKYSSTLQTTSYNFPATRNTGEICA